MSESNESAPAPTETGATEQSQTQTPPADGQQSTLLGGDAGAGEGADGGKEDKSAGEGDAGKDGGDGKDGDGAETGVPDAYEFKVPEGVEGVEIDQALAEQFTPVFKDLGLTQEQADKLVKVYAERVAADAKGQTDALVTEWQTKVKGWEDTARKDPEYGGDQFDANLTVAQQALARYSSPELNRLLVETGLGSHPDLLRAFVRIGKATAEDRPGQQQSSAGGDLSLADRMYPGMQK